MVKAVCAFKEHLAAFQQRHYPFHTETKKTPHSPRWMQCWHASKNHVLPVGKCKFRAFHRQHFATDSPTFYAYQSIPYSLPARSFHCYRSGNRGWLSATRVIYVSGDQAFCICLRTKRKPPILSTALLQGSGQDRRS